MERKINKEIREYREAMFWGLTLRQFLFSILGLGISVGIYFLLRGSIGMEAVSWASIFGMLPCAMLGFVSYNKMPAEKFLWAVIKAELLTPKRLTFRPTNLYYEIYQNEKETEHAKTKRAHQAAKKRAGRDPHQHRL